MSSAFTLAGRRTDAIGAEPRFPLENVALVRERLRTLFVEHSTSALICAAACGADLIALELAEALDFPAWIALPFSPAQFRESSVVDRPGDWGSIFDHQVRRAREAGRLIVRDHSPAEDATYLVANDDILDAAVLHASGLRLSLRAAIVWEGQARSGSDITGAFAASARERGIPVHQVLTL